MSFLICLDKVFIFMRFFSSNIVSCRQGEWTNERHSSYLDSLENSFVRQLYSLLGREETRSVSRTRYVQSDSHKSTGQVRNGCRHKVNFGKKRAYLATSSDYTIGNADQGNVLRKAFTRTSTRNSLGHESPARCDAGNILFYPSLKIELCIGF